MNINDAGSRRATSCVGSFSTSPLRTSATAGEAPGPRTISGLQRYVFSTQGCEIIISYAAFFAAPRRLLLHHKQYVNNIIHVPELRLILCNNTEGNESKSSLEGTVTLVRVTVH